MAEEIETPPALGISDMLVNVDDEKTELDKIFEQMLDPRNIAHNTDLTKAEAAKFARLKVFAMKYDWTTLKVMIIENLSHRVSAGRGGRKDWVKIAGRGQDLVMGDEQPRGRFGRRFAGGR
jgi:hypothetical protein